MLKIIVATREQKQWKFSDQVETISGTLTSGDYSVKGLEQFVAVERKELSDFIGCVGSGRDRFKRELHRLQAYRCKAVIIESDWLMIAHHKYRSQISPESVRGSIASWITRYNVPFLFVGNAQEGAKMCEAICRNFVQQLRDITKAVEENI